MKKAKIEMKGNQILNDSKKCPYCKKEIIINVIQVVEDGEFHDEMNTTINISKNLK